MSFEGGGVGEWSPTGVDGNGRWQWRIEHENSTPTREEEEPVQRLILSG